MPYELQETKDGWFVTDDKGKRYSNRPLSRRRAELQQRALYAAERSKTKRSKAYKHLTGMHHQADHARRGGAATPSIDRIKGRVSRLNEEIKQLKAQANTVTKSGGSWKALKEITEKIERLMEQRRPLLQALDRAAQLSFAFKHRTGQHNQKRHGWRGTDLDAARRAMRSGVSEDYQGKTTPEAERDAARAKFGLTKIDRDQPKQPPAPPTAREAVGDTNIAHGATPGKRYEFKYVVKDLDNVIASNTIDGGPNAKYTSELQPRMRGRQASKDQIDSIARGLDPDEILTDFHLLEKGPMIVGKDNMVESGNGRTIALKLAKEAYPERYAAYKKALESKLDEYGVSKADYDRVKNPVLVRERVTNVDRAEFAREANQPPVLGMSPLEQAAVDASRVTPAMIQTLRVGDEQSIDMALRSPSNIAFVRRFMSTIPANERAQLVRSDGSLNRMGLGRIKAAVFSKVFAGEAGSRLAETFLESLDNSIKNFENALSGALPKLAQAESLMQSGQRNKNLSMAEDFTKAIDMLARLRESGGKVGDYLAQSSMFGSELSKNQQRLLRAFDGMSRRPKEIQNFLTNYADKVINSTATGQTQFAGMSSKLNSVDDILDALLPQEVSVQAGLFG